MHTDPHTGGGEDGAEKQGVLLPHMCMYVIKNDYAFLNHIIIGHYWSSFSCWEMPGVRGILRAPDEETLSKVSWPQGGMQESMLQGQQVIRAAGTVANPATSP